MRCRPSTAELYRVAVEKYILPRFGKQPAIALDHAQVTELHHTLRDKPAMANKVIDTLSRIYNAAEVKGLIAEASNPCGLVVKNRERRRERFLTPDEFRRLGRALADATTCRRVSPYAVAAIRLLILTGCRKLARVGAITRAQRSGTEIMIDYFFDPSVHAVPNKVIFANMENFNIQQTFEFHRTHWAVKDIDLFRTLLRLSQPLRQSPKVFSIPKNEIIEETLASVMMPFEAGFFDVYTALQEAATEVGLACRRADEIWENPAIIQDIVTLIDKSFVVVCDCTGRNPNVFYEIGIAHTLGREVILISQIYADIPFDLRHLRYIPYLNNAEGRQALKVALAERFGYLQENL